MSTATPEAPALTPATPTCPPWCQALHDDPEVQVHIRLVDAVTRKPHLESVAVEIEQSVDAPDPLIVLSLFTQMEIAKVMSASLTIEQAQYAHTALGEALSLASETR